MATLEYQYHPTAAAVSRRRLLWRTSRRAVALVLLAGLLTAEFSAGLILDETRLYHRRGEEETARVRNALAIYSNTYGGLEIDASSKGEAYLAGVVAPVRRRPVSDLRLRRPRRPRPLPRSG